MTLKIDWIDPQPNIDNKETYPFDEANMIRIVKWEKDNMAIFYNKSRKEVEESFDVRLSIMGVIEFEINNGKFLGYEVPLKDNECYLENPKAEMDLMAKKYFLNR